MLGSMPSEGLDVYEVRFGGKSRQMLDEAKRKDALRKAEQIFVFDDPARAWFRFGEAQMLTSTKLQGLQPYPDQIPRFQFASLAK